MITTPGILPVATGRRVAQFASSTMRHHWMPLLGATIAMISEAAAGLGAPAAIGWITQLVTERASAAALTGPVVVLLACALVGGLAAWMAGRLLARAVLPALGGLREEVVAASVRLPIDIVEAGGSGDIVSRVSTDVEEVTEVAQGALGSLMSSSIAIVVTLIGLAGLDWRFALAALLAVPVQALTMRWYLGVSGPLYAAGRASAGRRAGALLETFRTLPTVRALRLAGHRRTVADEASRDVVAYEIRATWIMSRFFGRLNIAEFVGLGAIIVVAFVLVSSGQASVGAATAAALFFAGLFGPINTALAVFDDIQRAGAGIARLVGVVDAAGVPHDTPMSLPPGRHRLETDGLTFAYRSGAPAVDRVDLALPVGAHVALVGASGSGKTTLASIVAGVRHTDSGEARYGGIPLTAVDPAERGRTVAMVSQETYVFAGTIADNLLVARPDARTDDVRTALEAVGAHTWVDALPEGVSTVVGAGGHVLSPAHRQHLAFARLALLDPAVVVLDEATAEAGSDVAHTLDAAAEAVMAGRTALVVAHRLGHAATADLVLVMDRGRVIERGTHDELVAARGTYAALWDAWSTPGAERAEASTAHD